MSDVATWLSTALADRHPVERGIGAGGSVAERRDAAWARLVDDTDASVSERAAHETRPRRVAIKTLVVFAGLAALGACARGHDLDDAALRAADADTAEWRSYGRTYTEQRHSPLRQVDEASVSRLGLAWSVDMQTLRGLEATPLVSDGVLYTTSAWSVVYALDARRGTVLWRYDPQVPKEHAKFVCCDVVNRGVALYRDKVYVGTIDGRLVALDRKTGTPVWTVQTTPKDGPYAITGAPRIAGGRVVIGNA